MKCHVVAPFHTIPDPEEFSHCAFTQKSLKLVRMLKIAGYEVVEYANEGSQSNADEKVVMLSRREFDAYYPKQKSHEFHGDYANWGERGGPLFGSKSAKALADRVRDGDIVCHPFGRATSNLLPIAPKAFHVETGIGYPDAAFGCFRIFESEAWRHYHWGRDQSLPASYSWVIPNSFDVEEWPCFSKEQNEGYVLYMGRICPEKGMATLAEIIKVSPHLRFVIAGQGDFESEVAKHLPSMANVSFVGPVNGKKRAELVGRARCMVMPTNYVEPFGGAGVEGQLTGTPLVAVDYGAFTETVVHGVTGFRCKTLGDWSAATNTAGSLDRENVAAIARGKYSLEACAEQYRQAIEQIRDLSRSQGWYTLKSYRISWRSDNLDFERSFWGDCTNTYCEEQKHFVYARLMGLEWEGEGPVLAKHGFNVGGKKVLDIGGGPCSMLLKTINLAAGSMVCDPIVFPDWVYERYRLKGIESSRSCGEEMAFEGFDEVWIYNVLQHVKDPARVIENARKAAPVLRFFEWVNIPAHIGHPHELTEAALEAWIEQKGSLVRLNERGCFGTAFHGVFHFTC